MSIIDKVKENIKGFINSKWIDELFWITLVLFVAIGSFSLGMRHQYELFLIDNPVSVHKNQQIEDAWKDYIKNRKSTAEFFASKNGTVYYPLACPSGDRILQENRVYFSTADEARGAGYKQSSQCN